jgi:ribosome-associated translation inhibitor RaiA
MKITISCKQEDFRPAVEKEVQKHVIKLDRLLKHYSADLVQLHATFEKHPRKEEHTLSLNLSLPTGALHDVGEGADARSCIKNAFAAMVAQLKRRQQKLRKEDGWKRRGTADFEASGEGSPAD